MTEGLDAEHTTSFEGIVPTLGNLRWVFLTIVQVLTRYELFGVSGEPLSQYIFQTLNKPFRPTVGS